MKSMNGARKWWIGTCLSVLLGVTLIRPGWAGAPTDQLKGSVDQVIRLLDDPRLKSASMEQERRAAIRKEADAIFDFAESAKRALGPHWQHLSDENRQEFVSLYADLLQRAYISKIERYSGEKITYAGESADADLVTVKTRFLAKQGTEIPVDYRMRRHGDRWLVYDVFVEGVSLIANYRTQFNKIIQTASYAELVRKMKAAELRAPADSQPRDKAPRS
jgi:phospholipid transport system substrate-binding protein